MFIAAWHSQDLLQDTEARPSGHFVELGFLTEGESWAQIQGKHGEFDVGNVTASCELVPRVPEANTWIHVQGGLNTNTSSLDLLFFSGSPQSRVRSQSLREVTEKRIQKQRGTGSALDFPQ